MLVYIEKKELANKCRHYRSLINAFQASLAHIREYLTPPFLFLLTDRQGTVLSLEHSEELEDIIQQCPLRTGTLMTEESCGKNAISRAMEEGGPVILEPKEHYSEWFKTWHCYATPLTLGNEIIGYLDVSTIHAELQKELIAITRILPDHLLNQYQIESQSSPEGIFLTERQIYILTMIAQGHTVKSIALHLHIKECTVNHHKKVIFQKFGVQTSAEAVTKAVSLPKFQQMLQLGPIENNR